MKISMDYYDSTKYDEILKGPKKLKIFELI